ncbi:helix-turn-helix transcriptional regulator [Halobellus rufus]|uniref:helix-turn-helix transcriptional regulator n=1 Tax=Halobellus rufus TaxID=1448860 RepID=UPI000678E4CA|nr:MarR family transcriptional regulator [Halobellus rufus]
MADTSLRPKALLAAGIFVLTTTVLLVLVVRLVTPPSIVVRLGGDPVYTGAIRPSLTFAEAAVLITTAFTAGVSAAVLYLEGRHTPSSAERSIESNPKGPSHRGSDPKPTDELLEARRRDWEETADRLADTELAVYEVILEADGVLPQSEIVEETEFSKATVSRTLDTLEAKELIERKRRGVGNVVLLR